MLIQLYAIILVVKVVAFTWICFIFVNIDYDYDKAAQYYCDDQENIMQTF